MNEAITLAAQGAGPRWWGPFSGSAGLLALLPLALGLARAQPPPPLVPVPELGLRVQGGFRVSLFAGPTMANDIHALSFDPQGRVVVSGPDYIEILQDPEALGRAASAILFATPTAPGMGLCFDGASLYFSGNGSLARYEDLDGDGQADRPPFSLLPLDASEYGGHALHRGPDGALYLIGGCQTTAHTPLIAAPSSPIQEAQGGPFLRFTLEGAQLQVLADGFRNAWDFDFGLSGEILACDSGLRNNRGLPWERLSGLFHVTPGNHYGWPLTTPDRGAAKPGYYPDAAGAVLPLDQVLPRGMVCYRHVQFPPRYRGGCFLLDWAAGRVLFLALQPDGASFQAAAETFLEAMPPNGFTPISAAIAPDGSLFLATGGRKSHGSVLRVSYAGPPLLDRVAIPTLNPELNLVLQAPQPLEAWSRARWVPAARQLGPGPFQRVVADELFEPRWRIRAIEILTELFGGLPPAFADAAARSPSPLVRARVAWSLGAAPGSNPAQTLFPLLDDPHPLVRRSALEAVAGFAATLDSPEMVRRLAPSLGSSDKPVRLAAAHLASLLSQVAFQRLAAEPAAADPGNRLTWLLASVWRQPAGTRAELLPPLAELLAQVKDPLLRRDAICLIILALGDWNRRQPGLELDGPYEAAVPPTGQEAALGRIRTIARTLLPSGNVELDTEVARLLAMLQDGDPRLPGILMNLVTSTSAAQTDLHYLICLSRLSVWQTNLAPKVAETLLNLDRKRDGPPTHPSENWTARLTELLEELLRREPRLPALLLNHPQFPTPQHLWMTAPLGPPNQLQAAQRYLAALQNEPRFPWSASLVDLLSVLPETEVRPLFRAQLTNAAVSDEILLRLAARPSPADAPLYWRGLASSRLEVARACVAGLGQLPADQAGTNLPASLSLLRRVLDRPAESNLRLALLRLLETQTGERFVLNEPARPSHPTFTYLQGLRGAYQPVFAWLARRHPDLAAGLANLPALDPVAGLALLRSVPWAGGDPGRGERLALERGCADCHAGGSGFGPSLVGITQRFTREELFTAILEPSLEIAPGYVPVAFLLRDGSALGGFVLYDSAEVVLVQTGLFATVRLPADSVLARQPSRVSFMPSGLLDQLPPPAFADLYSFLQTLQTRP